MVKSYQEIVRQSSKRTPGPGGAPSPSPFPTAGIGAPVNGGGFANGPGANGDAADEHGSIRSGKSAKEKDGKEGKKSRFHGLAKLQMGSLGRHKKDSANGASGASGGKEGKLAPPVQSAEPPASPSSSRRQGCPYPYPYPPPPAGYPYPPAAGYPYPPYGYGPSLHPPPPAGPPPSHPHQYPHPHPHPHHSAPSSTPATSSTVLPSPSTHAHPTAPTTAPSSLPPSAPATATTSAHSPTSPTTPASTGVAHYYPYVASQPRRQNSGYGANGEGEGEGGTMASPLSFRSRGGLGGGGGGGADGERRKEEGSREDGTEEDGEEEERIEDGKESQRGGGGGGGGKAAGGSQASSSAPPSAGLAPPPPPVLAQSHPQRREVSSPLPLPLSSSSSTRASAAALKPYPPRMQRAQSNPPPASSSSSYHPPPPPPHPSSAAAYPYPYPPYAPYPPPPPAQRTAHPQPQPPTSPWPSYAPSTTSTARSAHAPYPPPPAGYPPYGYPPPPPAGYPHYPPYPGYPYPYPPPPPPPHPTQPHPAAQSQRSLPPPLSARPSLPPSHPSFASSSARTLPAQGPPPPQPQPQRGKGGEGGKGAGEGTGAGAGAKKEKAEDGKMSVGIDFGTTFTGIAYGSSRLFAGQIRQILSWPGSYETYRKVPTCILYEQHDPSQEAKVVAWGIEAKNATIRTGLIKCEWFKLLLSPESLRSGVPDPWLPPLPVGKNVVDVIADFLRCVWRYARRMITEEIGSVVDLNAADVLLTVPAAWDAAACSLMRESALRAGLVQSSRGGDTTWRDRLQIITEPEAGAIHASTLATLHHLRPSQCFLLCDAGGGTVDSGVYKLMGQLSELEIAEMCVRSGANTGSLFVDLKFEELLRRILKDHPVHLEPASMATFIHAFAEGDKLAYHGTAEDDDAIFRFNCFNVEDSHDPSVGLEFGELAISGKTLKTEVFDPVIEQVLDLISTQIAKMGHEPLSAIIMVGGFSASEYLYTRVRQAFGATVPVIVRPQDCDTATLRGAARYGLGLKMGKGAVSSVIAPRSYCMKSKLPAEEEDHWRRPEFIATNDGGTVVCENRLSYLIAKGAVLRKAERLRSRFCKYIKDPHDSIFTAHLYVSDSEELYRYTDEGDLHELCRWTLDLSALPKFEHIAHSGGGYIEFEAGLSLDSAEVRGVLMTEDGVECAAATFEFLGT
ncbi:hypothetical protein JCM10213_003609 [Rhodosporidiobolus nylandii]